MTASKSKKSLDTKKEVSLKLGKLWTIVNNMAQDRRIFSSELDDFNHVFGQLSEQINKLISAFVSMETEASEVEQIKRIHADKLNKFELCLELCGMSKKGIDDMMNFPKEFLETILSIRIKEGKALENHLDFVWLDLIWKGINIQINNDIESFNQALFFKKLYHETNNIDQKRMTIELMKGYAKDLNYFGNKLGKEIDENELIETITNHWYELYRNNPSKRG